MIQKGEGVGKKIDGRRQKIDGIAYYGYIQSSTISQRDAFGIWHVAQGDAFGICHL
jgi:hypothetical protein